MPSLSLALALTVMLAGAVKNVPPLGDVMLVVGAALLHEPPPPQAPVVQTSPHVEALPSLQVVPFATNPSLGQLAPEPEQFSATSH